MRTPNVILRFLLLLIIASVSLSTFAVADASAAKPNILLILADDMGYGDLQCMGSQQLRTPHLDQLAQSGVLCKRAYVASSVCSPSRAGLLTGRDPRRFGYEGNLNKGHAAYATRPELLGLPTGEHTLGDHLKATGYSTALIGKWHQGTGPGFHPNRRGFDDFCGMLGGGHNYFPTPQKHSIERNGERVSEFSSPYITDFFTDEAVNWIDRQHENSSKPWFMFLSYNAPHSPMQATETDLELFAHITDKKRRTYAAMVYALDRGVGRIRKHLTNLGLLENTLIVFFSDNGGATSNASWNGPLSGAKGCMKEGGIRVPMFWSWPGTIPSDQKSDAVMSSLDLLPTFLSAAKGKPLPLNEVRSHENGRSRRKAVAEYGAYDGIDLLPILQQKQPGTSRRLFWRLQGQATVLSGNDKLIRLSHRPAQMFSPSTDEGELKDLAASQPERFRELFQQLGDWEAILPTVPLWGSAPMWNAESAKHYDKLLPRSEPR